MGFVQGAKVPDQIVSTPIVREWQQGGDDDIARLALATISHGMDTSREGAGEGGLPDAIFTRVRNMLLRLDVPDDLKLAGWEVLLKGDPVYGLTLASGALANSNSGSVVGVALKEFASRARGEEQLGHMSDSCASMLSGHLRILGDLSNSTAVRDGAERAAKILLPILASIPHDQSLEAIEGALNSTSTAVRRAAIDGLVSRGAEAVRTLGRLQVLGASDPSMTALADGAIEKISRQFITAHEAGVAPALPSAVRVGLIRLATDNRWSALRLALLS